MCEYLKIRNFVTYQKQPKTKLQKWEENLTFNGPYKEIKPHSTRCKYPLINYLAFLGLPSFVGEIPDDLPAKRTCNDWGDCRYGERCHSILFGSKESYCVPDTCQKNSDCPNVGNEHSGLIIGSGCDGGYCVYSEAIALGK